MKYLLNVSSLERAFLMAHKDSINEDVARDVPRYKSELEDIDMALYNFINDSLDLKTTTNKGFEKVPVIWAGSERAHNIKNTDIRRDKTGQIILPVIVVERTKVTKQFENKGVPYAAVDPQGDLKGGLLTINKVIKQDKTSNFANMDAYKARNQTNFPTYRHKKNNKVVFETITIPIPIYVELGYDISIRTEYQEQMNDITVPFIRRAHAHKRIMISHNYNNYEAFIEGDLALANNVSSYEQNERKYETKLAINVLGYLIGDGKNQSQRRTVRRENAVQIRFARERIIIGDEDGEFRF